MTGSSDDATENLEEAIKSHAKTVGATFADHAPNGAIRRFGPVMAGSLGVSIPSFNRIAIMEAASPENLREALAWMGEREVPFQVSVAEDVVEVVESYDSDEELVWVDESPGMVLSPLADFPSGETDAEIAEVTSETDLADFVTVFVESFGVPEDIAKQVMPPSMLDDEAIHSFIGRVDGRPIATGTLIRSDTVAGVYNIAVVEGFRRRGIGEAITWETLKAGQQAGCRIGALSSTEMAVPLYQQMGFETVVTFHQFEPPDQRESSSNDA